jgi:hypothetical protein
MRKMKMSKKYLGDGVYADWEEDGSLVLTTENGVSIGNTIVLGEDEVEALLYFIETEPS